MLNELAVRSGSKFGRSTDSSAIESTAAGDGFSQSTIGGGRLSGAFGKVRTLNAFARNAATIQQMNADAKAAAESSEVEVIPESTTGPDPASATLDMLMDLQGDTQMQDGMDSAEDGAVDMKADDEENGAPTTDGAASEEDPEASIQADLDALADGKEESEHAVEQAATAIASAASGDSSDAVPMVIEARDPADVDDTVPAAAASAAGDESGVVTAPKLPAKPQTAYFLFMSEQRSTVAAAHKGQGVAVIGKVLGAMWKALSAEEKQVTNP